MVSNDDLGSSQFTWEELVEMAELEDNQLSWAQRFMLMLPMLDKRPVPDDAAQVLDRTLTEIGESNRPALIARLLDHIAY